MVKKILKLTNRSLEEFPLTLQEISLVSTVAIVCIIKRWWEMPMINLALIDSLEKNN